MKRLARFSLLTALLTLPALGCATVLEKAREADAAGDLSEAEHQYRAAYAEPEFQEVARAELAAVLMKRADESSGKEREDLLKEALLLDPSIDDARLKLARMYMSANKYEDGLVLLENQPECRGCASLEAAMLYKRGRYHIEQGEGELAREDIHRAMLYEADPLMALSEVEIYSKLNQGTAEQALAALQKASELIDEGNLAAQNSFREQRKELILILAERRETDALNAVFKVPVPHQPPDPNEFLLEFEAAKIQFRAGDYQLGLDRAASIYLQYGDQLAPGDREIMRAVVVVMYSTRAGVELARGDGAKAKKDLELGLFIAPDNKTLLLQQVIAEALVDDASAFDMLDELDDDSVEVFQVRAILYTMVAHEAMRDGKMTRATRYLEKAKEIGEGLPEYRVTYAEWLTRKRVEELTVEQIQTVREKGIFRYPKGRVNRYAEALAELHWAKDHLSKIDERHPFRAPALETRMETLREEITGFYPYEVEYNETEDCKLVIENTRKEPLEVRVKVRPLDEKFTLQPGESKELEVDKPGYTEIKAGGVDKAMVTEGYSKIHVEL